VGGGITITLAEHTARGAGMPRGLNDQSGSCCEELGIGVHRVHRPRQATADISVVGLCNYAESELGIVVV